MTATIGLDEIPGPRGLPLVGNICVLDMAAPIESMMRLAEEYGPIFRLTTPKGMRLIVSGPELVDEICDDARFDKEIGGGLSNLRRGPVGSGLFTSETKVISVLIYDLNESGDLGAISVIGLGMLLITFTVVIAVNRIPGFGNVRFRT